MKPKILFFIEGSLPSKSDFELADKINGKVCFRNANMISEDHKPEDCDYVTGKIPYAYDHILEWEFEKSEAKVQSNVIKPSSKPAPVIKSEPKTAVAGWKPNA